MLNPFVFFSGNCRAALTRYGEIFDAQVHMTRYCDQPAGEGGADFQGSDRIMLGRLRLPGAGVLWGCDYPPGFEETPIRSNAISVSFPDVAQARDCLDRLGDGGATLWGWDDHFWVGGFGVVEGFGMVTDRFGLHWLVAAGEDMANTEPNLPPLPPQS